MARQLLGLTGGIGSGKSTVARLLTTHGAAVVDADALAHAVTAPGGAAIPAISHTFGKEFITSEGALDRALMRNLVFTEPEVRQQLQNIVHPLVLEAVKQALARSTQPVVVIDVPLLVESGHWRSLCDQVVVVDCSESMQVQRVQERNGWSAEAAWAVIRAQAPRQLRLAAADAVLANDHATLPELSVSVQALARSLGL